MRKYSVLIVDDEPDIVHLVQSVLSQKGFVVFSAGDGSTALETFSRELPDLVILDINMPEMDGFEVCRRLRRTSQNPIIMLSARASESDKVKCLEMGADDYVTKPFGFNEFIARVNTVLRRCNIKTESFTPDYADAHLTIRFQARQVICDGAEIILTPTEFNLLEELVINEDKVLTHRMLLKKIWGPEYGGEVEYLHVFINRLRKRLEHDSSAPRCIVNISRIGYMFHSGGEPPVA